MTGSTLHLKVTLTAAAVLALACGNSLGPIETPPLPTSLVTAVTNPYYPLTPGTITVFQGQTADGLEIDTVEVLAGTKTVNGFVATEVHDRVYVAGSLSEDTYDWFAQDSAGNVWYLGEDTKQYANGQVIGTAGTWQWGVHGATPGIVMWGDPAAAMNKLYRQEFDRGAAEDLAKVVAVNQTVTVLYGTLTACVKTEEWNALEPGPHDHKYYCPQLGTVLEVAGGSGERSELKTVTP
jgi:hypothetical protein